MNFSHSKSKIRRERFSIEIRRQLNSSLFQRNRRIISNAYRQNYETNNKAFETESFFDTKILEKFKRKREEMKGALIQKDSGSLIKLIFDVDDLLKTTVVIEIMPYNEFFTSDILDVIIEVCNSDLFYEDVNLAKITYS